MVLWAAQGGDRQQCEESAGGRSMPPVGKESRGFVEQRFAGFHGELCFGRPGSYRDEEVAS
jgi:hypothetical protein